ncbi:molybdate ABC transporter substrate-binding protein [Cohnella pontilimi]|uniref:molybdate ABC transporter substrate-binding protein n=1 Tax=Cohnella pontilimi TaxID=2564100 RepID=UPI00145F4563|nr:molybdate ABC transporter substrate-binding protein [Cohnella pontilimi]
MLAFMVFLTSSCGRGGEPGGKMILVSAAVSLKESVEEIAAAYESRHPDIRIRFNYGSSGTLQKQIEQGAPADLFLSAGRKQMDVLSSQNLVKQSTLALTNRLVLIAPADTKGSGSVAEQLLAPGIRKVAMGEPDSVPAGEYALQAMKVLGMWEKLQSKLVYAHDVRQVLAYVETGNADFGFVYRTDAIHSRKVRLAAEIPETSHEPIVYPFGLLSGSRHEKEAADFFRYLNSEPAMKIFEKNGFITTQNT